MSIDRPVKILFIEDNAQFVATVREAFLSDVELELAASVAEAKSKLGPNFDAYLVDYDLPDGKGTAVVEAIRRADPLTPVIAISSHEEGNEALVQAGATESCPKADFSRLRSRLRSILGSADDGTVV